MAVQLQDSSQESRPQEEIEEEVEAGPKKKSPILLIVGVIVLLALIGVGVKLFLKHHHFAKAAPVVDQVGEVMPLDEFMMNLADQDASHYIKATFSLGLKVGVPADKLKDKVAQCRDAIVMVLSAKKLSDIDTIPGKIALKQQLKDAVNQSLGEKDVVAVYYDEFATQ